MEGEDEVNGKTKKGPDNSGWRLRTKGRVGNGKGGERREPEYRLLQG